MLVYYLTAALLVGLGFLIFKAVVNLPAALVASAVTFTLAVLFPLSLVNLGIFLTIILYLIAIPLTGAVVILLHDHGPTLWSRKAAPATATAQAVYAAPGETFSPSEPVGALTGEVNTRVSVTAKDQVTVEEIEKDLDQLWREELLGRPAVRDEVYEDTEDESADETSIPAALTQDDEETGEPSEWEGVPAAAAAAPFEEGVPEAEVPFWEMASEPEEAKNTDVPLWDVTVAEPDAEETDLPTWDTADNETDEADDDTTTWKLTAAGLDDTKTEEPGWEMATPEPDEAASITDNLYDTETDGLAVSPMEDLDEDMDTTGPVDEETSETEVPVWELPSVGPDTVDWVDETAADVSDDGLFVVATPFESLETELGTGDEPYELPGNEEPDVESYAEPPAAEMEVAQISLADKVSQAMRLAKQREYVPAVRLLQDALKQDPPPQLFVLIVAELSSIYQHIGQYWMAAELLRVYLAHPAVLDHPLLPVLREKLVFCNQLIRLLNEQGLGQPPYDQVPEDIKREALSRTQRASLFLYKQNLWGGKPE